jgi:hypothetical protein
VLNDSVNNVDPLGLDNQWQPWDGNNVVYMTFSAPLGGGPVTAKCNGEGLGDPLVASAAAIGTVAAFGAVYYTAQATAAYPTAAELAYLLALIAAGPDSQTNECPTATGTIKAVRFGNKVFEAKPGENFHEDILRRIDREKLLQQGTDAWEEKQTRNQQGGDWRGYVDKPGGRFVSLPEGVPVPNPPETKPPRVPRLPRGR